MYEKNYVENMQCVCRVNDVLLEKIRLSQLWVVSQEHIELRARVAHSKLRSEKSRYS